MGGKGFPVDKTDDFVKTFLEASEWSKKNSLPSLLHVKTGSEMVLPGKRFDQL